MLLEKNLVFSPAEFQGRLAQVRKQMASRDLQLVLLTVPENIYYLSGFQTAGYYAFQALAVPDRGSPILIVRLLERSNVDAFSWVEGTVTYQDTDDPIAIAAATLKEMGVLKLRRIGVEKRSWFFSISQFETLRRLLAKVEFVDCSGLVAACRAVKSEAEIRYIRRAAEVASQGMKAGIDAISEGRTENDVAAAVNAALILAGGEYTSLPAFVAAGERTSITHATWAGRPIRRGDVVSIELGGSINRYGAALYRSATVGPPSAEIARMFSVALDAFEAALAQVRPGQSAHEVDRASREAFARGGLKLAKRVGYSMGISFPPDWGEGHFLSLNQGNNTLLAPGMVFHIPSSYRVPGLANVAVSETVLVTEKGCEVLTNYPRELVRR